jgi:hypothetical protein
MWLGLVFWGIDDRVQPHAVPHGDIDFLFIVVILYKIAFVGVPLALRQRGHQQDGEDKAVEDAHKVIVLIPEE